ncbi:YSIRK-type signal peptide-containing protein [Aerococcus sp. CDC-944-U94]|uniref:adhesin domain containing protein n=1 Tax=Aerococcus urinae (strain CCUG 59500 / ACS-120-V-Col10a) TaxID=2976812 RepID=UPI00227CCEE1|nr:adhesin domain containing protein [Aerococcus sp. Group 1]MCY3055003.1 YSIRK-type signal peptide-containing protein [Aerococcus sp. Group 1]MCY3056733.1 YSIRK-type signal peptide-containing protein [Aerococcus sp. Group 1]
MEKNYRYAIRKTTLGVGSVAIAAFLAGQGQEVQAAETTPTTAETGISQPAALEASPVTPGSTDTGSALPLNEALNTAAPTAVPIARDGVARTENGTIRTTTNDSLAADEHEVKHYRDSDLANNGVSSIITAEDVGTTREGVTASVLNPSPTSTDKKKFGIQVEIDRANSDRTYTNVYVTDNKRGAQVKRGNGEFVKPGQDPDFANVNYPKTAAEAEKINAEVSPGRQITINITTGEEFLKDLNAVDNKNTTFAWKSEYTRDNPNTKMFTGKDFATGFSVNPYPNENKNLSIISVVGETNVAKVPVQGQYLKTGARIENLLPEDYTRITSEVYHPDGTVVDPKEARAILVTPDNQAELTAQVGAVNPGDIVFKMPEGGSPRS